MENSTYFKVQSWSSDNGGYWTLHGIYQTLAEARSALPTSGASHPRIIKVTVSEMSHIEEVVKWPTHKS